MDRKAKLFAGLAAVVMTASLAGSVAAQSPAAPATAGKMYKIGVSNWLQGNGWREEMICSMKAQALASGRVSQLNVRHRTTDAAGQIEDIGNLINAGVDAIVVNPISPDGLNPVIKQAQDKNIPVVAVDLGVTQPNTYLYSNDQEAYGYLGAKWLFQQMGGKGAVVYMRGAAGTSADTDRDNGFKKAMAEFPNITIAQEVFTDWNQDKGAQQISALITSGKPFDGIWTSGIDSVIVDALKTNGHPFVPIVGADNSGFVNQLLTEPGLVGAAVTNSAAVGGAGVDLAIQILDGKTVQAKNLTTPVVWDNVSDQGKAALKAALDQDIVNKNAFWPLVYTLPPATSYTKDQILACKGPGE
jgi:ribose transport system substrate-binding protein